jgi:hypothetical protein
MPAHILCILPASAVLELAGVYVLGCTEIEMVVL